MINDRLAEKILDQCNEERKIILNNKIDDSLIEDVMLWIMSWNEEDDILEATQKGFERDTCPIQIYINSIGGDGEIALALINCIESSKTPVYTYNIGKAFSAGFLIYIAGHIRFSYPSSSFMYHQTSYGRHGEHQCHVDMAPWDEMFQKRVEDIVLKYTKIPKKKLEEIRKQKMDWYAFGDEMAKYNVVDVLL